MCVAMFMLVGVYVCMYVYVCRSVCMPACLGL